MNRALGIDVSEWDLRPLDWSKAREMLSFVFIKISQGTNPDPLFRAQWEAAEGYVLRGLYHMLDPRSNVSDSVNKTIDLYGQVSPGELPPVLDLELGDVKIELPRARQWLELFEDRYGKKPIIYTSYGFLNREQFKPENKWLSRYPLWVSIWPFDNMSEAPRRDIIRQVLAGSRIIPYPSASTPWPMAPDFYQWTSRGEPGDIPGYYMGVGHKKAVDFNYYNGEAKDLFIRFGEPRERPGGGDMSLYKYSITPTTSSGSKIRQDHRVVDSPIPNRIGSLAFGRFAFGDELWTQPMGAKIEEATDAWLRVKMVDGVALEGWIAAKHQGGTFARITPLTIEPGDPEPIPTDPALSVSVKVEADITPNGLEADIVVSSPGFVSQSVKLTLPREL